MGFELECMSGVCRRNNHCCLCSIDGMPAFCNAAIHLQLRSTPA